MMESVLCLHLWSVWKHRTQWSQSLEKNRIEVSQENKDYAVNQNNLR